MTNWIVEHWMVEASLMIAVGFILAKIFCILADLMDKDD